VSFFKQISRIRLKRSNTLPKQPDLSGLESESNNQKGANLVQVRIEPDSAETKAQSMLKARTIESSVFTIGRRRGLVSDSPEDIDFSIRQVEPYTVSRRHCSIERLEDCIILHDLGGKYGSLVNGQRIGGRATAPKSIRLARGQYDLVLGPRDSTFRFKLIID